MERERERERESFFLCFLSKRIVIFTYVYFLNELIILIGPCVIILDFVGTLIDKMTTLQMISNFRY